MAIEQTNEVQQNRVGGDKNFDLISLMTEEFQSRTTLAGLNRGKTESHEMEHQGFLEFEPIGALLKGDNSSQRFDGDKSSDEQRRLPPLESSGKIGRSEMTEPLTKEEKTIKSAADSIAQAFKDKKKSYEDIAPEVAKAMEKALNDGVPLRDLLSGLNKLIPSESFAFKDQTFQKHGPNFKGVYSITAVPHQLGGFEINAQQVGGKWSVKFEGGILR